MSTASMPIVPATLDRTGPLCGVRVLEIAGIGPAPFCGMLLADLGADVIVIDRAESLPRNDAIFRRGKRAISLDLKSQQAISAVLALVDHADALIEGMRPGVMERLGLGPDVCLERNARLAYGRITGWGQTGPLAQSAGHDLNYIALSGALWYAGQPGQPPLTPPTLVGDIGGGALYLAVGLLAAIMNARATGRGQVVDAAIVDGSAHMMNLLLSLRSMGQLTSERGSSLLDGPHWYSTYRCADDRFISVAALEPKFYQLLIARLGLAEDSSYANAFDRQRWPELKEKLAALFATRTQAQWCETLEGTDACFAPVLTPEGAAAHPHMRARDIYSDASGVLSANPAPRFSATPAATPAPAQSVDVSSVLSHWSQRRD